MDLTHDVHEGPVGLLRAICLHLEEHLVGRDLVCRKDVASATHTKETSVAASWMRLDCKGSFARGPVPHVKQHFVC